MIYDYIIIGAGMGGLSAGINLILNKKKVLILEKNSLPGGLVSTYKKGRFEFDTSGYDIYNYGNEEHIGKLQKLLKKYEIDVDTKVVPFNSRIKELNTKKEYELKGEFEDLILELEEISPGVIEKLKELVKMTKEVHEAVEILLDGKTPSEEEYPNFYKYLDKYALDVLKEMKFPKEVINILSVWWLDLGSPLNKLSFIDYADFLEKLIFKKNVILNNKNLDFDMKLVNKYQSNGGKIYFNSKVINIINEDIKIVETKDGLKYKGKHIICDLAKYYVFKDLIKEEIKSVNRLENARTIGANGVVIYLGLNRAHEELGLNNYKYYQFLTLDSATNIKYMNSLNHSTWVGYVPNVVNEDASPKNTTILVLKQIYFEDVFKNQGAQDYETVKNDIADRLISQFEEAFGVDIKEYIEEIAISTPFTIERITNSVNGSMYGYMKKGYDSSIHRIISYDEEKVPGVSFVGASGLLGSGIDNAFYSGYYVTNKLLKEKE